MSKSQTLSRFPNPRLMKRSDDIIALSEFIDVSLLQDAYSIGAFPWPMTDLPEQTVPWFCPTKRAILEFKQLHITDSTKRLLKKHSFKITHDQAFSQVITNCSEVPRKGQKGTWITRALLDAYIDFHRAGFAHSTEVWDGNSLVGGVYGVEINGYVTAESMFHKKSNASKIALLSYIEVLKKRGCTWIDIQALTPHTESLGAREITRNAFLDRLDLARDSKMVFWNTQN